MSDKKIFLEYKQRNKDTNKDEWKQGYFELVSKEGSRITIRTGKNTITLPDHRWYIMKEEII